MVNSDTSDVLTCYREKHLEQKELWKHHGKIAPTVDPEKGLRSRAFSNLRESRHLTFSRKIFGHTFSAQPVYFALRFSWVKRTRIKNCFPVANNSVKKWHREFKKYNFIIFDLKSIKNYKTQKPYNILSLWCKQFPFSNCYLLNIEKNNFGFFLIFTILPLCNNGSRGCIGCLSPDREWLFLGLLTNRLSCLKASCCFSPDMRGAFFRTSRLRGLAISDSLSMYSYLCVRNPRYRRMCRTFFGRFKVPALQIQKSL